MPEWLIAVLMGVVQGVTEFLPISSTGHLIVVGELIGLPPALENTFEIVIQIGAVLAVIGFYRVDLAGQVRAVRVDAAVQRLWLGVAIAFVPAALTGFLFHEYITRWLFHPVPIAIALIVGGVIFLLVEWFGVADDVDDDVITLQDVTLRQALAVGLFQVLALFPGVSRSGASIVGGLVAGLNRRVATQFSFYLAIPTLGLATLYELVTNISRFSAGGVLHILIGIVVSAVVAWGAIGWLLQYVSQHTFEVFGYYRIVAGIVILFVFLVL